MADKVEKTKQCTVKHIPKEAQVIMSIMKDMDINEYEPRVINLLLEFIYRYVACVLEDAKAYGNHAKKKSIDLDDVKLALSIQLEQTFTVSPPRDLVTELARTKNSIQLPLIKPHCGIRLPQDRFCLSATNLRVKVPQFTKKAVRVTSQFGHHSDRTIKLSSKVNLGVVKRTNNLPIMSRTQTVSIPKPISKFTNVPPKAILKPKIHITTSTATAEMSTEDNQLKRKRENDDFDMSL